MIHHAFVSYAKRDRDVVTGLCEMLDAAGARLWIDTRYLHPPWREAVREGITASDAVLFVLSENWTSSGACKFEMEVALENPNKRLLALSLEQIELPIELQRSSVELVDGTGPVHHIAARLLPQLIGTAAG